MLEEQIFALRKTSESRLESLKKEAVLVRTYWQNNIDMHDLPSNIYIIQYQIASSLFYLMN